MAAKSRCIWSNLKLKIYIYIVGFCLTYVKRKECSFQTFDKVPISYLQKIVTINKNNKNKPFTPLLKK